MVITAFDLRPSTLAEEQAIADGTYKCTACKDFGWVIGISNELKVCPKCREVINLNDYTYTNHSTHTSAGD